MKSISPDLQLFLHNTSQVLSFPEIGDVPDYLLAAQNRKAMIPWHYPKFNVLWSTKHLLKIFNYLLSNNNLIRVPKNEEDFAILKMIGLISWGFSFAFDYIADFLPIWLLMPHWPVLASIDKTAEEAPMVVKLPLHDWRHVDRFFGSKSGILRKLGLWFMGWWFLAFRINL